MLNYSTIADALCQCGYWVGEDMLPVSLTDALRDDILQQQHAGKLKLAGVGRGASHQRETATRTDTIAWLDGSTPARQNYLTQMENLRLGLNRELMLGLFEFEAQFAHYAPAAYYCKHRDSFAGAASRVVSVVSYLNRDWTASLGGELVIYNAAGCEQQRVLPEAGTAVIFLSEQVLHEVLPASRDRYSIAGWFRVNASSGSRLDLMG